MITEVNLQNYISTSQYNSIVLHYMGDHLNWDTLGKLKGVLLIIILGQWTLTRTIPGKFFRRAGTT